MRKTQSFMLAALLALAVNAPVLAATGDGWDLDNVKPKAPAVQAGQQPPQGQPRRDPAMEARFRARGDTQRFILGAVKLEKDRKLAITKAQAVKLKPLIATIQRKDLLNLKNPTASFGRFGGGQGRQGTGQGNAQGNAQGNKAGFGGPDDKVMQELADTLTRIEKVMDSKQLGAIDAMEFPDLGGRFGGQGNGQGNGQANGQTGANRQGTGGSGQGFGGGGFRDGGGFADMDPKQLEKLRKEMEERQKKQAEVLSKGLKDLIALLDKRSK